MNKTFESPLFTFIQISDSHYENREKNLYPGANFRVRSFLNEIKNEVQCSIPDFFVITGDLTGRGSAFIDDLFAIKQIISQFPAPCYFIPGNHDLAPHKEIARHYPGIEEYEEMSLFRTKYSAVFGAERFTFSFEQAGIHLLGFTMRDEDPDGMVPWIKSQFANPLPKLIFGHYPLYVSRTGGPIITWEYTRIGKVIPKLKALFAQYHNRILAYIAGHLHINSVVIVDGVRQILTGSLGNGTEGYRYFKVFSDRIEVNFYQLQETLGMKKNFMLKGHSACDNAHSGMELYNIGVPQERDFSFSINSLKI